MTIHKLSTVDAFIAFDFDDADTSVGMVRVARKILPGGATELARSVTYTYAVLGSKIGGASAGINAEGDAVADAVSAFVDEVAELVSSGRFLPDAGKGLSEADLAPLRATDPRNPAAYQSPERLVAVGALAAARAALGDLAGKTARVDAAEPLRGAVVQAAEAAGAQVVQAVDRSDLLFAGNKMGDVDHKAAGELELGALVPIHPIPFTTKAMLDLQAKGTVVVPDFVSLIGPALAGGADGDSGDVESRIAETVTELMTEATADEDGLFLGACRKAETFLAGWRDELPFGRPLAP